MAVVNNCAYCGIQVTNAKVCVYCSNEIVDLFLKTDIDRAQIAMSAINKRDEDNKQHLSSRVAAITMALDKRQVVDCSDDDHCDTAL